jgi:parallel beta-helix repeat protein
MSLRRVTLLLVLFTLLGVVKVLPIFASPQANTYLVNTNGAGQDANPGDGICQTPSWLDYCTLEAAIQESNADNVDSIIQFSSQFTGTNDIHGCSLPAVTGDNTTIDASNQWDTTYNRPGVEIVCLGSENLIIQSHGNAVRGILFGGTDNTGVRIWGGDSNTIGGSGTHQRNVFMSGTGVKIDSNSHNVISDNYFGTIDGKSIVGGGSDTGIYIWGGSHNTIDRNVIVGHTNRGILVNNSDDNIISRNAVGTDWNHTTALPNKNGIELADSERNTVGPTNWLVGNDQDGLYLMRTGFSIIENNTIGYSFFGLGNAGDGIHLRLSDNNLIRYNSIQNNKEHGLNIAHSSHNQIFGNSASANNMDGIYILDSSHVKVGDGVLNHRNYIAGNGANGVHLNGASLNNVSVMNNDIGLSSGAFDAGNAANGVLIEGGAHSNTIGGIGAFEGNWIGFNDQMGVMIKDGTTHSNTVVGNVIGAPVNWAWEAPNGQHGIGIYNGTYNNSIGVLFLGNYILSSGWSGIGIHQSNNNTAIFNYIGTDGTDADWGNNGYGIHTVDSQGNNFNFNEIAFNLNGVYVSGSTATSNQITTNSIHDHTSTGIQLNSGGNNSLAAPVITSASCSGPVTGTACANCLVEIFSDHDDEGLVYEGWAQADGSGNFSWSGTPNGPHVTATATDSGNNTSPFSLATNLGTNCNHPPTASFTYAPTSGMTCTQFAFDASGSSDPEDPPSALRVRWDFDNNGFYETDWSTTKTTTHALNDYIYLQTVRMQVIDTRGLADTVTQTITYSGANCFEQLYLPLAIK